MKINFPVEETVKKRYSVRNYQDQAIESVKLKTLKFLYFIGKPLWSQHQVSYPWHQKPGQTPKSLVPMGSSKVQPLYWYDDHPGTAGPGSFGLWIWSPGPLSGRSWSRHVLAGWHLWPAEFFNAMQIEAGEIFPIITPLGMRPTHKHFKEKAMRKLIKADQRKEWPQLFFSNDFQSPLTAAAAGDLAFALEMVRLGPSASNKQPWRIVLIDGNCHFYEARNQATVKPFLMISGSIWALPPPILIFAMKDRKIDGHFITSAQPEIDLPKHMEYVFSWIRD